MGRRGGAVIGSKGPCEGVLIKSMHHEISLVYGVLSLHHCGSVEELEVQV